MFAHYQDYQQFYENQRRWEEAHHPLPMVYDLDDDNDYYYHTQSNSKRHGKDPRRYGSTHINQGTFDKYNAPPDEYMDPYYQYPDYHEEDDENNESHYYYQDTNGHPHNCHGLRSVSPSNRKAHKTKLHRHRHKSNASLQNEGWVQPAPFVNHQPMMMDPVMKLKHRYQQQILGTCTPDAMMPITDYAPANPNTFPMAPQAPQHVPIINHTQPYFLQLPTNANFPPPPQGVFHHHQPQTMPPFVLQPLLNNIFSHLNINEDTSDEIKADNAASTAKQETSPAKEHTTTPPTPTQPRTQRSLKHKKSLLDNMLSSFYLLGDNQRNTIADKSFDPSADVSLNNEALKPNLNKTGTDAKSVSAIPDVLLSPSSSSSSSSSAAAAAAAPVSASNDNGNTALPQKLSQKMNALQNREFIWCYRRQNEQTASWAAFGVKNQTKLDHHYSQLKLKKQQTQQQQKENGKGPSVMSSLPNDIITLSKQSQLNGPVMVSLNTATAWCFDNDSSFSFGSDNHRKHISLDIVCLPSQENRLVVAKGPVIGKSKSVDGLASKFVNIFKW